MFEVVENGFAFGDFHDSTSLKKSTCDTLEIELSCLRSAFSLLWPVLLRRAGLEEIRTRSDMDKLVGFLLSLGL